jgi:hypothetical protein
MPVIFLGGVVDWLGGQNTQTTLDISFSWFFPEVGKQAFFKKSPQIANPQILGLIPLSQIRKFLSLKVIFFNVLYYVQIWNRVLYTILVRRKSMYLWNCGSFEVANHKKIGSANRKSEYHICGRCISDERNERCNSQ